MNDQPKWFALRGEQYQYNGKWFRLVKLSEGDTIPNPCQRSLNGDGEWHDYDHGMLDDEASHEDEWEHMFRVPCSQPFQVGDWVKVSQPDGWLLKYAKCEGPILELCHSGRVIVDFGRRVKIEQSLLEPSEQLPAYIPPAGWRVKGDDEVVTGRDAYSHNSFGTEKLNTTYSRLTSGTRVKDSRLKEMPNGGYILTPIVDKPATQTVETADSAQSRLNAINPRRHDLIEKKSTIGLTAPEHMELRRLQDEAGQCADVIAPLPPQIEKHLPATHQGHVSPESQADDMDGWEIYTLNIGAAFSAGSQRKSKVRQKEDWHPVPNAINNPYGVISDDHKYIYRRPIQKPIEPVKTISDIDMKFGTCNVLIRRWSRGEQRGLVFKTVNHGMSVGDYLDTPDEVVEAFDADEIVFEFVNTASIDVLIEELAALRLLLEPTNPQPAYKPLDIHLPEIERKVLAASKDRPGLLDWWRGEKEALAIEAGKRIGGGM